MILTNLWKGIIVGLSASIPLGPIGVICIQRTLNKGRRSGFISGLGAAVADGLYAFIAGFGVKIVMDSINEYQIFIRSIGGVFLLFMSYKLYVTNPGVQLRKQLKKKRSGLLGDFFSVFALTISNPITLFFFAVVFAGFNVVDKTSDLIVVILLLIGVLLGAVLWWFTLTSIVNKFRGKFKLRRMLYINRVAAILIALFAISIIVSIFFDKSI